MRLSALGFAPRLHQESAPIKPWTRLTALSRFCAAEDMNVFHKLCFCPVQALWMQAASASKKSPCRERADNCLPVEMSSNEVVDFLLGLGMAVLKLMQEEGVLDVESVRKHHV